MGEQRPSRYLFHEDHAAQVFYQPGSADYLVITFSEMTMTADGRRFWGQDPLQRLGIPALGFVHKRRRWFADGFMRDALAAALPKIEAHTERISYGFSMGAYGAIRHAAALGARTVIACAPQWTIEPARLAGIGQPFAEHYREDKHVGMELSTFPAGGRLYLLYDPYDPHDAWHAARIREHIAETVLVRMPFAGHACVRPFSTTPLMAALVEAARARDDELMFRVVRHARRTYPTRGALLAQRLRGRRFALGLRLVDGPVHGAGRDVQARVRLDYAEHAAGMGRLADARRLAEAVMLAGVPRMTEKAAALLAETERH